MRFNLNTALKILLGASVTLLFISCGQNVKKKGNVVVEENKTEIEEEQAVTGEQPVAEEPPVYDWTPRGFKEAHPLEWEVLFKTDSVRQRSGEWSEEVFIFYDKEVNKYLSEKKITLPSDAAKALPRLEKIISENFSFEGYDDSNMGMHVSNGNDRIWSRYLEWKYLNAAKAGCPQIDWDKEKMLLDSLAAKLSACFYDAEGSGAWTIYAGVDEERLDCMQNILRCCLYRTKDKCSTVIPDYRFDAIFTELGRSKFDDRPDIIAGLKSAFMDWRKHRAMTYQEIKGSDASLAEAYLSASRPFERGLFIHLKNHLQDFGVMSESFWEMLLHNDCSDKEMYDYSYAAATAAENHA